MVSTLKLSLQAEQDELELVSLDVYKDREEPLDEEKVDEYESLTQSNTVVNCLTKFSSRTA